MSLTPTLLIADAQLLAYPYSAAHTVAPAVLLRELQVADHDIMEMFGLTAPERMSQEPITGSLTVVPATNITGYTLEESHFYTDWKYLNSDGDIYLITIVPEKDLDHPPVAPAGIVRGTKFYPADPMWKRWSGSDERTFYIGDGDTISYRYIADTARVTSMTQTLSSPDEGREYLVATLVLSILMAASASMAVPQLRLQQAVAARDSAFQGMQLMAAKRAGV